MKRSVTIAAAFALASLAAAQAVEVDQIAQQKMIGLSKKHIRLCMGPPARRVAVGSTDIWTYRIGSAQVEGFFLASGVNGMASWLGPDRACNVTVVMTNARVSQITYAASDGRSLPIGEHCDFAVENCAP
jgi:phospholipase/lecithinase/hemolysin